jgi:hypothetical protein
MTNPYLSSFPSITLALINTRLPYNPSLQSITTRLDERRIYHHPFSFQSIILAFVNTRLHYNPLFLHS